MTKIKQIFEGCRIVALAGARNSGKTNNIVYLLSELREKKKDIEIYAYGIQPEVMKYLDKLNIKEVSSLKQLIRKKDCLIVLDEFQKLSLNDRRYREQLNEFVDFVYHNNVYVLLSSPNVREFNSVIGAVIEKWLLKTVDSSNCVNGSQLKEIIVAYKGNRKVLSSIVTNPEEILLINDDHDEPIHCKYIAEADNKKNLKAVL